MKKSIKILATIKKCLTLAIIQLSQSIMINKIAVGKMKDKTADAAMNNLSN